MKTLVYLVGEPGTGKSTLMANATKAFVREQVSSPLRRDQLTLPASSAMVAVELGGQRGGGFSGTDSLPISAIPFAYEWIGRQREAQVVLAEGAKLANAAFFDAARAAHYRIHLIAAYSRFAEQRRAARAEALGRPLQAESWVKGQITRMQRFVDAQCRLASRGQCVEMWAIDEPATPEPRLAGIIMNAIREGNT